MKNILLNSIILLLTLSCSFVYAIEKTYSLSLSNPEEPASLKVEVNLGSVSIIGYEGETVEITTNVSPVKKEYLATNQQKFKPQKQKKKRLGSQVQPRSMEGLKAVKSQMLHLEIEEEDNKIDINSETMNQHVDLIIKLPNDSAVTVKLRQGGDILVENIQGELELESYQGGVMATNVSGPIVAETYTQDIVVEFSEFSNLTPTSLTSHIGNVDISLTKDAQANINVQTYQGEIFSGLTNDFTMLDDVKKKNNNNKQKIVIGGTMQAKVNGGGQDLSLTTYSGNLYIRQAQ